MYEIPPLLASVRDYQETPRHFSVRFAIRRTPKTYPPNPRPMHIRTAQLPPRIAHNIFKDLFSHILGLFPKNLQLNHNRHNRRTHSRLCAKLYPRIAPADKQLLPSSRPREADPEGDGQSAEVGREHDDNDTAGADRELIV